MPMRSVYLRSWSVSPPIHGPGIRLTQRELAEQAEVSPSYLAEIETGKKPGSAAALRKLSRVLAIPMENLVSRPV